MGRSIKVWRLGLRIKQRTTCRSVLQDLILLYNYDLKGLMDEFPGSAEVIKTNAVKRLEMAGLVR